MVCKQVVTNPGPGNHFPAPPHWQLVIAVRGIRLRANKTVLTQFQGPIQLRSAHETVIYIAFHLLTVAMGLRLKIAQTLVMVRGF